MTEAQMKKAAQAYAEEAIQTNLWGEEERELRKMQMYHAELSKLYANEAKRRRGEL